MKIDLKEIIVISLKLFIVVLLSAVLLAVVYSITIVKIEENEKEREKENIKIIMPDAKSFEYKDNYYVLFSDENKNNIIGYIFKTASKGYGGNVICNIGIRKDGKISGIVVVSHSETPGLGSKIEEVKSGENEPYYLKRFKDKSENELGSVETISGATISSKAVIGCVKESYKIFNNIKN